MFGQILDGFDNIASRHIFHVEAIGQKQDLRIYKRVFGK